MSLAAFLDCHPDAVQVRLARVRGSAPREEGAGMVGAATTGDKRPEVIAAGTLTEIMTALAQPATRATACRATT